MKFYTSDLHIGHKDILTFDDRPFFTLKEMTDTLVQNWNNVVDTNDEVYVLGDFFWSNDNAVEILESLRGKKYLILGNHDNLTTDMEKQFVWIKQYAKITDNKQTIVLFHYPIAHWNNADYGAIHLYGHIHKGKDSKPFERYSKSMQKSEFPYECYNVGCMLHGYTPKTLEQLRTRKEN